MTQFDYAGRMEKALEKKIDDLGMREQISLQQEQYEKITSLRSERMFYISIYTFAFIRSYPWGYYFPLKDANQIIQPS